MNDELFLQRFEAADLPEAAWHHREHLRVAYLYLRRYSFVEAMEKARSGIQAVNAAQKIPESIDRGYHETMTLGWMRLVQCALAEFGPEESSDAFLDKHSHLLARRALLFFYSRDRLMSAEAKARFIEPDLTALPSSHRESRPST